MKRILGFVVALAVPVALGSGLTAASKRGLTVDTLLDWHGVADPRLSPDGSHILYAYDFPDKMEDVTRSNVWVVSVDGQDNRPITQGNYRDLARFLKERDDLLTTQERQQRRLTLAECARLIAAAGPAAPTFAIAGAPYQWLDVVNTWRLSPTESFNSKTLRGMIALEAGETAEARRLLDDVLREAGDDFYTERPVAERYAALLARYQPR